MWQQFTVTLIKYVILIEQKVWICCNILAINFYRLHTHMCVCICASMQSI